MVQKSLDANTGKRLGVEAEMFKKVSAVALLVLTLLLMNISVP